MILSSYHTLFQELIQYFNGRIIPVTLVSFCERDDEETSAALLAWIKDKADISIYFYRGDIHSRTNERRKIDLSR